MINLQSAMIALPEIQVAVGGLLALLVAAFRGAAATRAVGLWAIGIFALAGAS